MKGLSKELLDLRYRNRWFKLFVRKEFGGAEASLQDGMRAMFEASSMDGSLGWCVNLGGGASYFSGFINKEAAIQFLSMENDAFAGSGVTGKGIKKSDCYEITGRWPKCTGAAHATSFTVNAELEDGKVRSFILSPEQLTIRDNWTMLGLGASSTFEIEAREPRVPDYASFEIGSVNPETAYSVHHIPFEPFARCCMIASLLGMMQCYLNELRRDPELLENTQLLEEVTKVELFTKRQFDHYCAQASALENQSDLDAIANRAEQIAREVNYALQTLNLDLMRLFRLGGLYLANEQIPANKAFRDILVAGQHPLFR